MIFLWFVGHLPHVQEMPRICWGGFWIRNFVDGKCLLRKDGPLATRSKEGDLHGCNGWFFLVMGPHGMKTMRCKVQGSPLGLFPPGSPSRGAAAATRPPSSWQWRDAVGVTGTGAGVAVRISRNGRWSIGVFVVFFWSRSRDLSKVFEINSFLLRTFLLRKRREIFFGWEASHLNEFLTPLTQE